MQRVSLEVTGQARQKYANATSMKAQAFLSAMQSDPERQLIVLSCQIASAVRSAVLMGMAEMQARQ